MDDGVELRDLRAEFRRRWWIPAFLAVAGIVLGLLVAKQVAPVHRAQGSLLVGPINGTVTLSTTLRASESLAAFYADLARRQVVLDPATQNLRLSTPWEELRNQVSAVVSEQNPRLVTVTVSDSSSEQALEIAGEIVDQLVSLSPAPSGGGVQAFVSQQVTSLQGTIERGEEQVDRLEVALSQETDANKRQLLARRLSDQQERLNQWRRTYVELMSVDPTSDAGGLQLLDDVRPLTSLDRADAVRQAALGGVVGFVLGLLVLWLLLNWNPSPEWQVKLPAPRPRSRAPRGRAGFDRQLAARLDTQENGPGREAHPPQARTAARQAEVMSGGVRSPDGDT